MTWIVRNLWLIPALPVLAGGAIALAKQRRRVFAISMAVGSLSISLGLALIALMHVLHTGAGREFANYDWFQFGDAWVRVGWMLDPLTAVMLVMVTFVGLLIFVFSIGYMEEDENFTRFFCFLTLFAGAMLGVLISNSLLLLFMCWEVVGLTSYLLIGFWYAKPSAGAAAKKAFVVTRIGDIGFFLGMVWLYAQTGTLLFYDGGAGCMESQALAGLVAHTTMIGVAASTAIAVLIFCGAAGKSGQFPLHVWLPDAMEGPTPVSALIHAATMVAAGVFLVARVYPLMSARAVGLSSFSATVPLEVVTWVGAVTALFGALVAVAQWDIKRILAYSTVSQLGYMMIGLGTGGVAVGMFHLITHAFFKALLFLGAGSVIHGCGGEQDIRRMGGLRKAMPATFAAYTCGMLALCGFPLFAGFWSKDEILHAALHWSVARAPFYMGAAGALLTAFYMTRQMYYVYAGPSRLAQADTHAPGHTFQGVHESPAVMTVPLAILACFAVLLGFCGTAAWPWFQSFLNGDRLVFDAKALAEGAPLMLASTTIVFAGIGLGWLLYGRRAIEDADAQDPVDAAQPALFRVMGRAFLVNEFYANTAVRLNEGLARASAWLDEYVWGGGVRAISALVGGLARLDNMVDTGFVNRGFDAGCRGISEGGQEMSRLQGGRVQGYLRWVGVALLVIVALLMWGGKV